MLVPKGPNKWRVVIDYTPLNRVTLPLRYDTPGMQHMFHHITRAKFFSKLDIEDAFYNIPLVPEHWHLTAFSTPWGDYEFKVLPQGWCNSPAYWQRAISLILAPFWHQSAYAYMDDIALFSDTAKEHFILIRQVLATLRSQNLPLNDDKSVFARHSISFLGTTLSFGAIKPQLPKNTIRDWPTPTSRLKLQQWLGTVNAFRPYLPNLSSILRPMERGLTGQSWSWTAAMNQSFHASKHALLHSMTLATHVPGRAQELVVDASLTGLGCLLKENGRVIAIISRKLTPAEMNYDTKERELLAVIWTLATLSFYLHDSPQLTIHTDHLNLVTSLQPSDSNRRLNRWLEQLSNHNIRWVHVPGKHNPADGPSRLWER
jgi:hypothetical protein